MFTYVDGCTHMRDQRTALFTVYRYVYTCEIRGQLYVYICRHVSTHVRARGQLLGASFLLPWFKLPGVKLRSLGSQQAPLPTEPAH